MAWFKHSPDRPLNGVSPRWKIELTVFALVGAALIVLVFYVSEQRASQSWEDITATIVRYGSRADYSGDHPVITVRLANGVERQVTTSRRAIANCTTGDQIALQRQGIAYRVAIGGCAQPITPRTR